MLLPGAPAAVTTEVPRAPKQGEPPPIVPHPSFAAICRHYEISRKTGYKWLTRLGEEGLSFALRVEGETHATLVLLDVAQGDRYFNHRVNHQ